MVAVDISPRMVDHLKDRHKESFAGQEVTHPGGTPVGRLRLSHQDGETTIDAYTMDFDDYFMEAPAHRHFDLVVLSRICIHQVFPEDLAALVASACNATRDVFLAEDVRERKSGPFTRIWTIDDYRREFAAHSFSLKSNSSETLGADNIQFLHFSACPPQ